MEQNIFFELIKRLSLAELQQVEEFASISFYNNGKYPSPVRKLFSFCQNYDWSAATNDLEKETLYNFLFPGEAKYKGKLEKVFVEALKVLRIYLNSKYYFRPENDFARSLDLAEIYRTRGLHNRYALMIKQVAKNQLNCEQKDHFYFFRQIQLDYAIHYEESINNQKKGDLHIPDLLESIELYYHIRKYALINRYLLQLKVTKLKIPEIIKKNLNSNIPESYLQKYIILNIYYSIFNIIIKTTPQYGEVSKLFKLVNDNEKNIDPESLQEFYTYLRNFLVLILMENPDQEEIFKDLHEIYIENLKHGHLHYEGKLSPGRLLAVTSNALRIKKFDWALDFIEQNKNLIHGEDKEHTIYRFNLANYYFEAKKFSECLDTLPSYSIYADYLLLGKRLELKALYETGSDLFYYRLDSFKMFLSRTSAKILSEILVKKNLDFINILRQISNLTTRQVKRSDLLVKRILQRKNVIEKPWLLEKAFELRKKK